MNPWTSGGLWVIWSSRVAPFFESTPAVHNQFYRPLQFSTFRRGSLMEGTVYKDESHPPSREPQWKPAQLSHRRAVEWEQAANFVREEFQPVWRSVFSEMDVGTSNQVTPNSESEQ